MPSCSIDLNLIKSDIDDNLKLLYLPTTQDVVGSAAITWAMVDRIDKAIALSGNSSLYLSAVARAGTVGAGVYAAFWAGAVIGSSARAFYRNTTCTTAQAITFGRSNGVTGYWLESIFDKHPELLNA